MISAIGLSPVMAAPMAAPRIACSEIGQSRTRFGPNCSRSPTVALNTPPALATSSPKKITSPIARHLLGDAARHRVAIGQFRHAQPPSAYTSVKMRSAGGIGAALQASVAVVDHLPATSWSIPAITLSAMPNCASRAR